MVKMKKCEDIFIISPYLYYVHVWTFSFARNIFLFFDLIYFLAFQDLRKFNESSLVRKIKGTPDIIFNGPR
jgi:hypothetical protein